MLIAMDFGAKTEAKKPENPVRIRAMYSVTLFGIFILCIIPSTVFVSFMLWGLGHIL